MIEEPLRLKTAKELYGFEPEGYEDTAAPEAGAKTEEPLRLKTAEEMFGLEHGGSVDAGKATTAETSEGSLAAGPNEAAETQKTASDEAAAKAQYSEIKVDMPDNDRYEALRGRNVTAVEDNHSQNDYSDPFSALRDPEGVALSRAKSVIVPLAQKLGILNRNMRTPDLNIDFIFSKKGGLKESITKQTRYGGNYEDFAKALVNLDSILQSARLIEKHGDKYKGTVRENRNLIDTSVLLGLFRDGDNLIPVQMEIKNDAANGGRLYMTVAMTKIKAGVVENAAVSNRQAPSLLPASEYRLADVFANVNPADAHVCVKCALARIPFA